VVNALSGQPARRSRRDAIEQSVGILSDAPDILFAAGYLIDLTASERISSRWPASTRAVRSRHRRLLAGDLRCGHWLLQRLFGTTAFRHVERHADHESATVVEGFRRQ
jgi:hypothetical protein